MKSKPVVSVILIAVTIAASILLVVFFWPSPHSTPYVGQRKAIILCSANDFFGSENDEFNNGNDSDLGDDAGNWTFSIGTNCIGAHDGGQGHTAGGSLRIMPPGGGYYRGNFTLNWTKDYFLKEYAYYNVTAWVLLEDSSVSGAKIGLRWLNSSDDTVRIDWSEWYNASMPVPWQFLNVTGVCNNDTNNEITNVQLVLHAEGVWQAGGTPTTYFDDIKISTEFTVNITDPTDPPPPPPQGKKDTDGFPAQALQVYWILKNQGYTDDNILLMLYYKGDLDGIIDINKFDAIPDDLNGAIIDIANDSVTATRLKQELNVSVSGSFASELHAEDQLIIFMTDHGSNKIQADGNATFHFESDGSSITELEFYNLVKEYDCERMLINVDCCFSGNFLNSEKPIGNNWYNLPNSIMVSAAANVLSWYWVNNNNGDGWAGSWFFHVFWDQLDQGQTIQAAYNIAVGFMPAVNPPAPLGQIQNPLMKDNLGIANSWSFSSTPQL